MIEPYETALHGAAPGFSKLGFSLVRNTEYEAMFSDGTFSIEFSTDRYHHPGLSGAICGPSGKKFEIGLLQAMFDPVQREADIAALKEVRLRFGLEQSDTPKETRMQGITEYVRMTLDQVVRFFAVYRDRVLVAPNEYEAEYIVKSNALMSKFIKVKRTT